MTECQWRKRLERNIVVRIQSFMEADKPVMMFTLCAVMTVFSPFSLCPVLFFILEAAPMGKGWYGGIVMVD